MVAARPSANSSITCHSGEAPPPPLGGGTGWRRRCRHRQRRSCTRRSAERVRRNHRECGAIVGSNRQWRRRVGRRRCAGNRRAITEPLVGNRTRTGHLGGKRCGLPLERGCVLWLRKNDRRCQRCRGAHGGVGIQQAGTALPRQSTPCRAGTSSRMRANVVHDESYESASASRPEPSI